jgi:uncharacterized membrane protein YdjX (TVP38/TMEM64 family)
LTSIRASSTPARALSASPSLAGSGSWYEEALSDPQRSLRNERLAAVVAVLAGLLLAYELGVFHELAEPARLGETMVRLGPWGYLAFIAAYAALQPFGVPGTVFIMAAPLIWPWPVAFALSMTGTMAASVVGFSFARFVARDWLASKVPARFRKYDDALARRAFTTVFVLRLVFWMPPMLHVFFGVSKVRFSTHFWGSLLGYLLPLFLVSFFGQALFDWMKAAPLGAWIGLGAAIVGLALGTWLWKRRRTRSAASAVRIN